jgi:hypothetical protein
VSPEPEPQRQGVNRGRALLLAGITASLSLVVAYLALGGASYEPRAVADPCEPREWRSPDGVEEMAEQFSLSALDGAACELQVSRETLTLALATEESREEFAEAYGVEEAELEAAVRAGLVRAIDDAEAAGALPGFAAGPLREVAERMPVEEAIALIEDAESLFGGAGGLLEQGGALLDDLLD